MKKSDDKFAVTGCWDGDPDKIVYATTAECGFGFVSAGIHRQLFQGDLKLFPSEKAANDFIRDVNKKFPSNKASQLIVEPATEIMVALFSKSGFPPVMKRGDKPQRSR